jgi:hypothetical protein
LAVARSAKLASGGGVGAAGTAGKFQRNLFKADSQQGKMTLLAVSMRRPTKKTRKIEF